MAPINWTPGGAGHAGPGNLSVGGDAAFQALATKALTDLSQTASGLIMLNGILATKTVAIVPFSPTYSYNCCVCPARNQRSLLAQAWLDDKSSAQFGQQLQAARAAANFTPATLAAAINNCPRYRIQGVPPVAAGNYGVTAAHVTGWESNAIPFPAPHHNGSEADQRDLYNALMASLWPHIVPSGGTGSKVYWGGVDGTLGIPSQNARIVKPAAISLGHELMHAYYNARGEQINIDDSNSEKGVLYEYMAVGLGPWAGLPSENMFRSQIGNVVKRTMFRGKLKFRYGVLPARVAYG